jgi:hypothetical protein
MNDLLSTVAAKWRSNGATPNGGASAHEIEAFEAQCGIRLPSDVRAYFALLNGMDDNALDADLINFWSLKRVRSVAEEFAHQEPAPPPANTFFCFADYSVWCNAYAVRLSENGSEPAPVVAVYSGVDLIPSSESFVAFLRAYVSSAPETVLHPRWEKDGTVYGAAT